MRAKIWATLVDLRFKGYCLMYLVNRFQRWERNINIFLAIASSTSIAAWAIWGDLKIVWGIIIALSQVLTVVKPYFPYFKYVKELNSKCLKIETLNIEFERLWHKMQTKQLSDQQAEDSYFDLKKAISETLNFGDDTIFDVSEKMEKKANEKMKIWLKNHYDISIKIT
jgi:hypothetical protein